MRRTEPETRCNGTWWNERWRAITRRSQSWLASLIRRLYAVARLILRDADRAEDATQEALVRRLA